jgi:hypothetical protein
MSSAAVDLPSQLEQISILARHFPNDLHVSPPTFAKVLHCSEQQRSRHSQGDDEHCPFFFAFDPMCRKWLVLMRRDVVRLPIWHDIDEAMVGHLAKGFPNEVGHLFKCWWHWFDMRPAALVHVSTEQWHSPILVSAPEHQLWLTPHQAAPLFEEHWGITVHKVPDSSTEITLENLLVDVLGRIEITWLRADLFCTRLIIWCEPS